VARLLLLVPSASYRARDFLAAARALGVDVVVGTEQAHALAEVMGSRTLEVPLDDPTRAARVIVAHDAVAPLDAVIAVDDMGTLVAAEASALLGLRHNPPDAVAAARDKLALRTRLAAFEVPQPVFAPLAAGAGPEEIAAVTSAVGLPCVVKPTTLSGSQGVLRADTVEDAVAAVAPASTPAPPCSWSDSRPAPRSPWRASCSRASCDPWRSSTSPTRSTGPRSKRPST
jgi:biotin carboxylase